MAYSVPGRAIVQTFTEGTGDYTFSDPLGDSFQLPVDSPQVASGDLCPFYVVDDLEAPTRVEMNGPAEVTATTQARNVIRSYDPENGGWGTGAVDWPQGAKYVIYDLDPETLSKLLMLAWGAPPVAEVVTTVFTSSDTWDKPDNLVSVEVTVIGGGGAGGGSGTTTASQTSAGSGGWSGAVAIKSIDAGDLSSTETVTVGAGGTGAADTTGGTGGASSFGSHCAAGGGPGGNRQTNSTDIITPPAGSAGTGTDGDINIRSRPGAPSYVMAVGLRATGGNGADSILGAGGLGVGRGASDNNSVAGGAGEHGGGGGGAASGASAVSGAAGGAGGAGLVIVKEYRRLG